ncbi:RepA protein [Escherichia coli]|nr:RepA protein [Escherichia coli]
MLAENIDGSCGAVVADQTHLASLLGVGRDKQYLGTLSG